MAENPNDTTQVRDAKAARTGKFADDKFVNHPVVPGPHPPETKAEHDARARDPLVQTTSLDDGVATRPLVTAEQYPLPAPVTLHLMDADERTVLDRVQVKVRPLVFELDGNRFQQVREQPDGSWVYRFLPT